MSQIRQFLLIALCLCSIWGCRRDTGSADGFNTSIYTPAYAGGFRILGAEGKHSVVLEALNPWQGADSTVSRLFIGRGGEKAPEEFDGQVIEGDAKRIVAMSSTQIAMLDEIGETGRVKGVSGRGYISNADIRARGAEIVDVGYEGNVDYELLMSADPDLVLLYGITGASPMESKLRELGIPYFYVGEYLEPSPLGKAEWLVALGEITGKREEAIDSFCRIPQRYNELRALAAGASTPRPKVMINTPYGDTWVMASTDSYVGTLIRDAGGDYLYRRKTSASEPIDIEEAFVMTSGADKWINLGQITSAAELKKMLPKFAGTKPVVTGEIYNTTARCTPGGGNDYWESGVVRPDIVLRDLIKIFHPELVDEELFYYTRLK